MKTVNLFFHNGKVWHNAVGDMARQLETRLHTPDFRLIFGEKASDGNLVHYFDAGPAAQAQRPGLMSVHQISPRMPGRMLSDRVPALERHLGVVVLTHAMAEQVRQYNKRVYVIPGGIGECFTPATAEERLARTAREPFTVGLVGHQRHGKFDTKGAEALANVMELCPEYRYRIVGQGWDGFVTHQQGLGRDVRVTGLPYEQMPDFYRGLDVLLCLSREEGGCLPILEALSCGVPIVSTRVGYAEAMDLPDFAMHVVDFVGDQFLADAQQVADQLRFLDKEREGVARGGAGIAALVEELTWQKFADRHEALYQELLSDA